MCERERDTCHPPKARKWQRGLGEQWSEWEKSKEKGMGGREGWLDGRKEGKGRKMGGAMATVTCIASTG